MTLPSRLRFLWLTLAVVLLDRATKAWFESQTTEAVYRHLTSVSFTVRLRLSGQGQRRRVGERSETHRARRDSRWVALRRVGERSDTHRTDWWVALRSPTLRRRPESLTRTL